MNTKKLFSIGVIACSVSLSQAHAVTHALEIQASHTNIAESGFESGINATGAYVTQFSAFQTTLGLNLSPGIKLKDSNDYEIDLNSVYLLGGKAFKLNKVSLELNAGIAYSQVESKLHGRDIGSDSSTGFAATGALIIPLNRWLALNFGLGYIDKIADTSATYTNLGVRFSF